MTGFPIGILLLLIVSVLIFLGFAHRVLDRLYLSDKVALGVVIAMVIGSFIDIPLGARASINVGGGLIPIGLAIYVLSRAGTSWEWIRAVLATLVTVGALYGATRLIGAEPENMVMEIIYVFPIIAGVIAYLIGRSRRTAFIAATLGVLFLDVGVLIWYMATRTAGTVAIGGAGAFDSIVIAGLIAVLLAEVVGEIRERLQGGPAEKGRPEGLLENLRGSSLRDKLNLTPERKPAVCDRKDYEIEVEEPKGQRGDSDV